MSGVKGRSGRRAKSVEEKHLATLDKCWKILDDALDDKEKSSSEKLEIAKLLVGRDVGRHIKGKLTHTSNFNYLSSFPSVRDRQTLQLPEPSVAISNNNSADPSNEWVDIDNDDDVNE